MTSHDTAYYIWVMVVGTNEVTFKFLPSWNEIVLELGRWAGLSFSRGLSDIWASRGLGLLNSVLTLSYWWLERGIGRESRGQAESRLSGLTHQCCRLHTGVGRHMADGSCAGETQ